MSNQIRIVMTAQLNTPPYQAVTWSVFNQPDNTGAQSGYPLGTLINIQADYLIDPNQTINPISLVVGGDLSGSLPSPTVVGIRGNPIVVTAPVVGQTLVFNGTSWVPSTVGIFPTSKIIDFTQVAALLGSSGRIALGGNAPIGSVGAGVRFNLTSNFESSSAIPNTYVFVSIGTVAEPTAYFVGTAGGWGLSSAYQLAPYIIGPNTSAGITVGLQLSWADDAQAPCGGEPIYAFFSVNNGLLSEVNAGSSTFTAYAQVPGASF